MSSIVFDKELSNDVILVLAEFFRIGRVFPVLADFFLYWPSLFRIGQVCHQYDASRFCNTNAIFMRLINNIVYYSKSGFQFIQRHSMVLCVLLI